MAKNKRKSLAVWTMLCVFFVVLFVLVGPKQVSSITDYTPVTEEGTVTSMTVTDITVTGTATIATAVISSNQTTDTTISAAAITVTGASALNGGITVDSTAFIVADTSGNITTAGTLDVAGAVDFAGTTEFADNTCTITDATGAIATDSNLTVGGNTILTGTVDISGAATLDGGFTVDTNKFTVADGTGNTLVAGTFAVTSTSVFTGGITANGGVTLGAGDDLIGSATSDITMNTSKFTVAGASGDVAVNTNKFTVAGATGNTLVAGTFAVTSTSVFTGGITANGGVTLGAGDDLIGGATSDIAMNSTKFTVAGASGNVAVNTNKFTIAGATGNTLIAGTTTQSGNVDLNAEFDCSDTATFGMSVAFGVVTITTTSDAVDVSEASILNVDTNGGHVTIGGFVGGVAGQVLHLFNSDTNNIIIEDDEAGGNQDIKTHTGADFTVTAEGGVTLIYDGDDTIWRVIGVAL